MGYKKIYLLDYKNLEANNQLTHNEQNLIKMSSFTQKYIILSTNYLKAKIIQQKQIQCHLKLFIAFLLYVLTAYKNIIPQRNILHSFNYNMF